jgi:predicted CoA-substrate-specific enzyme activase
MHSNKMVLGVDIGSVSISLAALNPRKEIVQTAYEFHQGNIAECLKKILRQFDLEAVQGIAATTSSPDIIRFSKPVDNRVAIIDACRWFHGKIGSIILVGGEKFGLIRFDPDGNYCSFKANTSCAAGTGSFLDQQARRLNLEGIETLSEIAFYNKGLTPKIASRCAVFAKTDLVHAQQEGFKLSEICDGLCYGLAKNIADTLFGGQDLQAPIIFAGGVSRNRAVVKHIESIIGKNVITGDTFLYGAIGAALNLADEIEKGDTLIPSITDIDDVVCEQAGDKTYAFEPVDLKYSNYPDFSSIQRYEFQLDAADARNPVEVDIYTELNASRRVDAYLGIDIGSTSTKAVLYNPEQDVVAGFYTRTAGRPVESSQKILAAIDDLIERNRITLNIIGVATTGSGRKFSGKIMGADLIIDEITAHARAAVEFNPLVDTIIEIGGQDSKFTTLQNGRVTFCAMNAVCAAGTGSFIEEQAQRLDCPLTDYAARTEGQRSPMASDRCTVFMERDLNHYLNKGYSVDETLTAVLHSIRENYLTKVAIENSIGNVVFFQGATAKNKALVAAFEQRLERPIHVSKFCHLTGALGAALYLADKPCSQTRFRGLALYKKTIPIQSEACEFCTNHCKITVTEIDGEKVAYGFLCGRDYDTPKFINNNRSGFDLIKARKKAFAFKAINADSAELTIGIPAALHLCEDLFFWQKFFDCLSVRTFSSEGFQDSVAAGKHIAGAEFCAPMTALHGHVHYLQDRMRYAAASDSPDYIFLPVYLEIKSRQKGHRRQYCYYTQFATGLAANSCDPATRSRILRPLVKYLYNRFYTKAQLYRMLKTISCQRIRFKEVSEAFDRALQFKGDGLAQLKKIYRHETRNNRDVHVVLLGRPYTVLDKSMNKGIPDLFAALGIKTFYQDMLSYQTGDLEPLAPLLNEIHWHYAAQILAATEVVARTNRAYPVLITSFKCSPDSFVIEYFKQVMETHNKPYLILQLDEHSSSVGYETRIEAAIRAFRNHDSTGKKQAPAAYLPTLIPKKESRPWDKTIILPNWDSLSLRLIVANLKRAGIDARLLNETVSGIQKSMRFNTGQCLPLNIIAQDFIDYIETHDLDPEKAVLWMANSEIACNIKLYHHHFKNLFYAYGKGFEKAGVYAGEISFADISLKLPINTYFAYMFGGFIRKIGCRVRPYEKVKGTTDDVIENIMKVLEDAFLGNRSKSRSVEAAVASFEDIEVSTAQHLKPRPQVAIFGDLYARDNPVINQDLIHFIEGHGGEVVTTPYSTYVKIIAKPYLRKWLIEGRYLSVLSSKALLAELNRREKRYLKLFNRFLKEPEARYDQSPAKILSEYNICMENTGESMDNILKIFYTLKYHPAISLFVQTSPAFCCPALVTEAMAKEIERKTGVPVVSITYDGTGGPKNDVIIPYLKYPRIIGRNLPIKREKEMYTACHHNFSTKGWRHK